MLFLIFYFLCVASSIVSGEISNRGGTCSAKSKLDLIITVALDAYFESFRLIEKPVRQAIEGHDQK